jgi:Lantibiotic dehydratase, N terminus
VFQLCLDRARRLQLSLVSFLAFGFAERVPYRVAPIFLIRLAGAPFEIIENLATPETARAARNQNNVAGVLQRELDAARKSLLDSAREILPHYLIFGAEGMRDRISSLLETQDVLAPRNSRARERERHLLLYLQRIAAKNDTFSEFGPSGWGTIGKKSGVALKPQAGIAQREAFLERWVAHTLASALNADPENSNPKLVVPALEPHAVEVLLKDVQEWLPSATRDKWLSILEELVALPQKFIETTEVEDRQSILDKTQSCLRSVGAKPKGSDRFLYAATNPIGEECFRECHFEISDSLIDEVAVQAEPWIDLWRDSYAFIASRVAFGLRTVMEKAGAKDGAMPLPAFMQACEAARLPLTGPGLVALAVMAFQEVKAAFQKQLQSHVDLSEYELTAEDCHVVRDNFDYPKFDDYTFPSADLQLSATSTEAIGRGDYQWILAELHPPIAMLHHCMFWSCPDKEALGRALTSTVFGRPNFHFGFFAADFTAHTTVRLFDAMPDLSNFVAPQRANPKWRKISPADAEVYVDKTTGDVCVRKTDNQEHLGSFARAWVIPLGFHPFQFSMAPHTPRLRCGKVIVQRQSWTISVNDLPSGNYTGVSSALVVAVEKLRAEKNLPRFVYIRPTEQALRRSGAEGRDKDTKPVFVDLESYLFLEIFHRWLMKAGEIEVTEMLPAPEDLFWKEKDGRHSFELRTLIVPRS